MLTRPRALQLVRHIYNIYATFLFLSSERILHHHADVFKLKFREKEKMKNFVCLITWLSCFLWICVFAHPQDYDCNGPNWKAGGSFNHMLVDKFTASTKDCVITGVPPSFKPGHTYQIKLVSLQPQGHKLAVENGLLQPDKVSV
jgi:hypothetical protein